MFAINTFAKIKGRIIIILQYGTGSTIGFTVWPDLTSSQLLRFRYSDKKGLDINAYSKEFFNNHLSYPFLLCNIYLPIP